MSEVLSAIQLSRSQSLAFLSSILMVLDPMVTTTGVDIIFLLERSRDIGVAYCQAH